MDNDNNDNNGDVIPLKKNLAKTTVDWEALFESWIKTDKTRAQFLKSMGFDLTSEVVLRQTKDWVRHTNQAHYEGLRKAGVQAPRPEKEINELWQIVQQWRKKQGLNDYQIADSIRTHLKIILNNAIINKIIDGKETIDTRLKPSDLSRLADVAEKVQKIQRLALGMSTENIGVDQPTPETHVEKSIDPEDNRPIYIVEVNQNGKFIRNKPRQIK